MLLAAALLGGCASIIDDFEAAKAEALADPGAPKRGWRADARLDLSDELLDRVLDEAVAGTPLARAPLVAGPTRLTPDLRIATVKLVKRRPDGSSALVADLRVEGPVTLSTPLGDSSQRVAVDARLAAELSVVRRGEDWAVVVHPTGLDRLSFEAEGLVSEALSGPLRELVLTALPDVDVARLSGRALPLRAIELERTGTGTGLRLRTAAPDGVPLPELGPAPEQGFRLVVSTASLQQLARREAFLAEPLQHDVVAEPTSFVVEPSGAFDLGVRLWRPVGRGWWRDCEVQGTLGLERGRLHLEGDSFTEVAQSPGADLLDPLVALAEGVIYRRIEEALVVDVPLDRRERVAGAVVATRVAAIEALPGALVATGDLELRPARGGGRGR